jgi:hypothetical protein
MLTVEGVPLPSPIEEVRISGEAAIAVADLVRQTDIVQSTSFNQLVLYLYDAMESLDKAEGKPVVPQHTIFPSTEAADEHLAGIESSKDVAYRLSRSGDGKCVVQVFKLSGLL